MYLSIAQFAVSILLVVLILLQERSSGLSGAFGGGDQGGFYAQRRGLERIVFYSTILLVTVFAGLSLLNLVLSQ